VLFCVVVCQYGSLNLWFSFLLQVRSELLGAHNSDPPARPDRMFPMPTHTSLRAINLCGRYEPEQCRMTGLSVCWRYTRYHRNNTTTICPRGSRSIPELIAVLPTHDRTVATSKTVQNNKVTIVPFVMKTLRFMNLIYLRHHL
jgi:hypothetical protein